ncbi:chloride channel protein [Thermosulfuriphilus sp.]
MRVRTRRLVLDAVLLGIIGALSAKVFIFLLGVAQKIFLQYLAGYLPPGLPNEGGALMEVFGPRSRWMIPLATTLGGLLSGLIVYTWAPEAEGHGTDAMVRAFHRLGGYIRARVPFLKMIASAITIGSGGAAGREGPTALVSAGVGSLYARVAKRPPEDRRLLMLMGSAAGLSAIFRSPIGTALFTIEVLYSEMEFEASALVFTLLAAVIAYTTMGLMGICGPLFEVPPGLFVDVREYYWYAILGILSGPVATVLPVVFYGLRDLFLRIPIRPHFKPALGGLGLGIIAIWLPQVLGGGYGWIQMAMDGGLSWRLMMVLLFAKMLAFPLTVSSGGSGGVFAPSLFVGGMLGGAMAGLAHLPPASFVVVGMAAVFGGAARVPIAAMFMVVEMTGAYLLLVPAALAVLLSYLVQNLLAAGLKYQSLYEYQVPNRAESAAHQEEFLQTALDLLLKRKVSIPKTIGHLNLLVLLELGIPLELPDGKRLVIQTITPQSPWLGHSIKDVPIPEEAELIALVRKDHLIFPQGPLSLEPDDKLLFLASIKGWKELNKIFG